MAPIKKNYVSNYSNYLCVTGQWQCNVDHADHMDEVGFISLLNSEMGFVRDVRLPVHAIPDWYNITLVPFIIEVYFYFLFKVPHRCINKFKMKVRKRIPAFQLKPYFCGGEGHRMPSPL